MTVVLFPLSSQAAAPHPEQDSALLGGPAAAKDILAMETELNTHCTRSLEAWRRNSPPLPGMQALPLL